MRRFFAVVLAGLGLILAACAPEPPPRPAYHVTVAGSDSMNWIARALIGAYAQTHPQVTFSIQTSNTQAGLRAAREYTGTIGLVARALAPSDLDGMTATVVARDGIAVIVNDKNPISAIQKAQIVQVFSGEILTWPTGPDTGKNIVVVSREAGSGTRDAFESMVMNKQRVTLTAVVMPSEAAVADYVAQHTEAIGYTSMGGIVPGTRALVVEDAALTIPTVESQKYPFVRPLSLMIPLGADPELQGFVDWAQSAEAQALIGERFGRAPRGQ